MELMFVQVPVSNGEDLSRLNHDIYDSDLLHASSTL